MKDENILIEFADGWQARSSRYGVDKCQVAIIQNGKTKKVLHIETRNTYIAAIEAVELMQKSPDFIAEIENLFAGG